jgi:hypothetical protein
MSSTNKDHPAFPTATLAQKTEGGMTLREYAAIKLKVPDSGTDWLDEMIRTAQRNELAAKAMQGWAADSGVTTNVGAKWAYEMADAMQKASNA